MNIVQVTCITSLFWLFSSHAFAGALPSSLSDLKLLPTLSELECPTTGAEAKEKDAPHEIEGLVGGAELNYTQALGNVRAALEASISPEAAQALESSPLFKDPDAASRIALIAMAGQKPLATLGALIKAHELAPIEPLFLANLSSISNYYGFHREALAFAEKAEPLAKKMPDFQHAALLSNKGYALTSLGRPQEAEAALQEAIRLAPDLSEAYNNLAYSLGDQDKCPQAVRYLRASISRRPASVLKRTPQATEEMSDSEEEPERVPLGQVIDLSKGKRGVLPAVPIASDPSEIEEVRKLQDALSEQANKLGEEAANKIMEASQGMMQRRMHWSQQGVSGRLTSDFAELLTSALSEYTAQIIAIHMMWLGDSESGRKYPQHPDPDLQPLTDAVAETSKRLIQTTIEQDNHAWPHNYKPIMNEYDRDMRLCEQSRNSGSCRSLASLRKNSALCVLGKQLGSQRLSYMKAHAQALRSLYAESFYRASAVAAHFSDPSHRLWAQTWLDQSTGAFLGHLLMEAEPFRRVIGYCEAANSTPMDILFAELRQMAEECEASAKASASASVFSISASCEKIEVGVSTPGDVGLFADVSYEFSQRYKRIKDPRERFLEKQAGRDPDVKLNLPGFDDAFDGKLTVFTGVQATASAPGGVAGAGVKVGGYTTFKGDGNITDAGGRVEVSGTVSAPGGVAQTQVFATSLGGR